MKTNKQYKNENQKTIQKLKKLKNNIINYIIFFLHVQFHAVWMYFYVSAYLHPIEVFWLFYKYIMNECKRERDYVCDVMQSVGENALWSNLV